MINCSVQTQRKWIWDFLCMYMLVRVQQEERKAHGNTIERRKAEWSKSQREARRLKSSGPDKVKEVKGWGDHLDNQSCSSAQTRVHWVQRALFFTRRLKLAWNGNSPYFLKLSGFPLVKITFWGGRGAGGYKSNLGQKLPLSNNHPIDRTDYLPLLFFYICISQYRRKYLSLLTLHHNFT